MKITELDDYKNFLVNDNLYDNLLLEGKVFCFLVIRAIISKNLLYCRIKLATLSLILQFVTGNEPLMIFQFQL